MTAPPKVLVVDDEADLRELFEITLVKMGLDVDSVETVANAMTALKRTEYSMVITDMRLPDGQGLDVVQEVTSHHRNTPVTVITAYGSTENAVTALKAGAFDYITKPVSLNHLRAMVLSALRQRALVSEGRETRLAPDTHSLIASRLTGNSDAMANLRSQISRLARSMAPIAISGESGTGKELAAREIHSRSARADKPFVAVNCGAIPESLMEAEFFGYRKGAFTGAAEDREGFFQAANGGTLLLDEVADLPLSMQVKLLRAIQERSVRKLGSTSEETVDVRIICASHQNLADCVEKGSFRQDLYYRLNVIGLNLPPLRDRREDIEALAKAILIKLAGRQKPASLTPAAVKALQAYDFPGNVRELENILERALAFANEGIIDVADLVLKPVAAAPAPSPATLAAAQPPARPPQTAEPLTRTAALNLPIPDISGGLPIPLPEYLDTIEREIIRRALAQTRNNRTLAAQLLGISFRQLRYQIQRLNIQEPES
ncbi:MAG: sigma-54-dependent Fis family transcriptional regulator [Oxalobacter sp.]|nr:MAG: sigma-54-dependent Fis family transcriptional regulator [Oxalobacter sp.]